METLQDMGSLQSIRFSCSATDGCYLWKVVVEDVVNNMRYTFPFRQKLTANTDKALFLANIGT
jgi:hypothetical protein